MKSLLLGITLSLAAVAGVTYLTAGANATTSFLAKPKVETQLLDIWPQWKYQNNKVYMTSSEDQYRFGIFKANYNKILLENARQASYKLGLNKFSDQTQAELTKPSLKSVGDLPRRDAYLPTQDIPKSVDWRTTGAVTSVKNQGSCGSSWAYGVVGAIEGLAFNNKLNRSDVSVQQLVDCTSQLTKWNNNGCFGGSMTVAFEYLLQNGWETEKSYQYKAKQGDCAYDKKLVVGQPKSYYTVPTQDTLQMMAAVAKGPVATAVKSSAFYAYKSGIFECHGDSVPDHGILIVGYGSENGQDFWILKNSWDSNWGEDGFMRISRGNPNTDCGIAQRASYPTY